MEIWRADYLAGCSNQNPLVVSIGDRAVHTIWGLSASEQEITELLSLRAWMPLLAKGLFLLVARMSELDPKHHSLAASACYASHI